MKRTIPETEGPGMMWQQWQFTNSAAQQTPRAGRAPPMLLPGQRARHDPGWALQPAGARELKPQPQHRLRELKQDSGQAWSLHAWRTELNTLQGKVAMENLYELCPIVSIMHKYNWPSTVTQQRKWMTFLVLWGFYFRRKCSPSSCCQLLPKQ